MTATLVRSADRFSATTPPASAPDQLSDVELVEAALNDAGIAHGPLTLIGRSNNAHFSDGTVFVKLARTGTAARRHDMGVEAAMCLKLAPLGLAPEMVHDSVLDVAGRPALVARYRPAATSVDPVCLDVVATRHAVAALTRIHQMDAIDILTPTWTRTQAVQRTRLDEHAGLLELTLVARLYAGLDRWIDTLDSVVGPASGWVPVHSDPHCGNLLMREGKFDTWCDFECAGIAPPEWDIAAFLCNLTHYGQMPNRAATFVARIEFTTAAERVRRRVDWDMVQLLIRARLVTNAIWSACVLDDMGRARKMLSRLEADEV